RAGPSASARSRDGRAASLWPREKAEVAMQETRIARFADACGLEIFSRLDVRVDFLVALSSWLTSPLEHGHPQLRGACWGRSFRLSAVRSSPHPKLATEFQSRSPASCPSLLRTGSHIGRWRWHSP